MGRFHITLEADQRRYNKYQDTQNLCLRENIAISDKPGPAPRGCESERENGGVRGKPA